MTRVLFLNSLGSINRGCIAVQTGCIKSIRASMPDAEITIWSARPDNDTAYDEYSVKICQHPWGNRKKSLLVTALVSSWNLFIALIRSIGKKQKANTPYDVLISLNMDGFNDRQYGIFFVVQGLVASFFPKIILKKPIMLIPASIGPFRSRLVKRAARYVLNRFDVVTARGEISLEYLQKIGVNKPRVYLAADLGFLLPSCSRERAENILQQEQITTNGRSLVGLSPSIEMGGWSFPAIKTDAEKKDKYTELMAKTGDYIIEQCNAMICFIPNVAADPYTKESADTIAARQIIKRMKHTDEVKITSDSYSSSEIKGIISKCDMFFSCRMHAAIAATSMCVPTVVMAYGTKFDDVIGGTMGQQKCMVRIEANPEQILAELKSKLDYVWKNRDIIRNELKLKSELADKQALQFGQLVKQAINLNNEA